jgi:hypothetical protein
MQMNAVFILKVQTACMYFDVGMTFLYIDRDLEIRKSGLHYDKKKRELYGHMEKTNSICLHRAELSKAQGAGQPQGLPRRAHTPICTIGSDQLAIRAEE